ncbi:hypothetical protein CEP54_007783 [Fusarium duplospermum]|uniref:non-specific serine/threonine protein kinase n=1 Tax=Fusarium duplospermum TaxID=1325734 RepID=A0A428PZF0_9HYPO|nr:hypothetical protein CEP54_007783 [Fusarium duplospermum]
MSSKRPLVSDLVRDSKINTEFLESCIQHVFHETGQSLKQRLIRREERWVRQRYLGQGAYGTVYLERREDGGTEELRAVKELKKSVGAGQELDYARELEAIMKFSHPRYRHCFVSSRGWYEHQDSVFITMEFLELGDLQRYLTRPLPESQGQQITKQTLEGLGFMHDNGFIHRDLKPANIMVVTKGPNWFVKIADFGISRRRHQDVTTSLTLQRGTLGFAAPEALGVESEATYSFWVDMWSLGAVAYRILTNTSAILSLSDLFRYTSGKLEFPEDKLMAQNVSELGRSFIIKLMQPVPEARLSAAQAMLDPWFTTPLLATSEDESNKSHSTAVEGEHDITDISMPSKAWSTDDQSTISTPVPVTARQYHQVTDLTLVSKARSPENPTTIVAHRTATPVSKSNYQPPSVEDCSEDNHQSGPLPKLPDDSKRVLDLEDDIDDDEISEINATTRWDDSQLQPFDTKEGTEAGYTDEESEYETSTDSDSDRGEITTSQILAENTEKESVKTGAIVCHGCSNDYEWEDGQIEFTGEDFMCHACLLQSLALSLISPKYLRDQDFRDSSFRNILVDQCINDARAKYEMLMKHDNWRCPRGHPPKNGSLSVTVGSRNSPPTWREIVNCSSCLTETRLPGGFTERRPTPFCILCSSELRINEIDEDDEEEEYATQRPSDTTTSTLGGVIGSKSRPKSTDEAVKVASLPVACIASYDAT